MPNQTPNQSNEIEFQVNGKKVQVKAHSMTRLLDVLRENLHLTGTKEGCGEGECGACSVFLDGQVVNSCLVPIEQVRNREIKTIEGISNDPKVQVLQQCFLECGGAQCGICTPGMIVASTALLEKNPQPSLQDIKEGLGGNLCRCTGYMKIFDSVQKAAQKAAGKL